MYNIDKRMADYYSREKRVKMLYAFVFSANCALLLHVLLCNIIEAKNRRPEERKREKRIPPKYLEERKYFFMHESAIHPHILTSMYKSVSLYMNAKGLK